ncbi:HAMP domain-containing histidine kinase [SAR202 cluster bacterium AC-409-J13_OGT_754m]|nr:HAMP domain-containing histidine kinase [SAR202 cluster bacterium AC-409-J13_OGT_754m]
MSLRSRITLVVSGFTALIVLISGGVIHQLTEDDIRTHLDNRLYWQVEKIAEPGLVSNILTNRRFYSSLSGTDQALKVGSFLDAQIPTRVFVGRDTAIATGGFPNFPLISFPEGFSELEADGTKWRVYTKILKIPPSRSPRIPPSVTIQTAMSWDSMSTTLRDFRERFFIIGIIAVIGAGIGGWFLGGAALSPINRLRIHTETVRSSQDLSQRIPGNFGPDEVEILAQSLNEMLSRLEFNVQKTEQALSSSREFASNVAHELRTPLTSMKMNLDMLERYPDAATEERAKMLSNIIREQDRLVNRMESLRLLARGDLSEEDVFEEIDFAQLIQDVIGSNQNQKSKSRINLYLPPDLPLLRGWREGLSVLFRNVIENAYVHSGVVDENLVISISAEVIDKWIEICIDDNGIGIDEFEREQVMGRFVRGSKNTGTGSGLGLSLVDQQVNIHGGSIEISRSPLDGARVSIKLPIVI